MLTCFFHWSGSARAGLWHGIFGLMATRASESRFFLSAVSRPAMGSLHRTESASSPLMLPLTTYPRP